MNLKQHNLIFKITALILSVLCVFYLSTVFYSESFFEFSPASKEAQKAPSSLSPLSEKMAFSRDTTIDAFFKQELYTSKMCNFICSIGFMVFVICFNLFKSKHILRTKTIRLLI